MGSPWFWLSGDEGLDSVIACCGFSLEVRIVILEGVNIGFALVDLSIQVVDLRLLVRRGLARLLVVEVVQRADATRRQEEMVTCASVSFLT